MKTVRDDEGNRYILLKRSGDASLVRDPTTGNDSYIGNDRLVTVDGASPLEAAAGTVDAPLRRLVTGVANERALGLLVILTDRGPLAARTLLAETDCCESDLNGLLASLTASELIEETTVSGERGYTVTRECERALSSARGADG